MRKERTTYSKDFKIKAVELSKQRGSVISVAEELSISIESLRHWKRAYNLGKLVSEPSSGKNIKTKEDDELVRLRKELYEVKLERDILKKAVGIFSKSDR